jgi:Holliday junction resolvase RusA-like endonuclease
MITLALPFPVSTNAIWRSGRNPKTGKVCVYRQKRYLSWRNAATGFFYEQGGNRLPKITGHFRTHIVLSDRHRRGHDSDNFTKGVLDFCQHAGLIANDKFSDRTTVEWGHVEAPAGCIVTLSPVE